MINKLKKDFSDMLSMALKEKGWNQSDLARDLKYSRNWVSQVYLAQHNLTLLTMEKMLRSLGKKLVLGMEKSCECEVTDLVKRECDLCKLKAEMENAIAENIKLKAELEKRYYACGECGWKGGFILNINGDGDRTYICPICQSQVIEDKPDETK